MDVATGWSTQQLTEFLAEVATVGDERAALQRAVDRVAEALEAELGAVVGPDGVEVSVGVPARGGTADAIVAVARGHAVGLTVPGLGRFDTAVVGVEGSRPAVLVVGRMAGTGFSGEEQSLLRGFARVLSLTLRILGRWGRNASSGRAATSRWRRTGGC